MMKIDLHLHTYFSDGILTPEKVVDNAIKYNLDVISITDHDTIQAIPRAKKYSAYKKIKIIPGIEFSCIKNKQDIHILGYNIDYKNESLLRLLEKMQDYRIERVKRIVKNLRSVMDISYEEVCSTNKSKSLGRPHIAEVIIDKGYAESMDEAFGKYLNRNNPFYVEKYKLDVGTAVNLIHDLGGVAVLAHPITLKDKKYIGYCIKNGIDGIETIHSKHNKEEIIFFNKIARQNNIMTTAGSDCHGRKINNKLLIGEYYKYVNDLNFLNMI